MSEQPLTYKELESAFKTLKTNSSPGFDGISPSIVKQVFHEISLLHIFSMSLNKGIFPNNLKIAMVTPIFKTGDEESCSNYIPISVLPCFSKILERIV